jgi:hypothetical protein
MHGALAGCTPATGAKHTNLLVESVHLLIRQRVVHFSGGQKIKDIRNAKSNRKRNAPKFRWFTKMNMEVQLNLRTVSKLIQLTSVC